MMQSDKKVLAKLFSRENSPRASTDELQGLLLQVVFALLMVFMFAYFMFVGKVEKEREEQVMELTRQKLTLALEKVAEDSRIRYGLNALMVQGADGKRTFEADAFVSNGKLVMTPATRAAFSAGSAAAFFDYSNADSLAAKWRHSALNAASLTEESLKAEEKEWFENAVDKEIENVRLDVRGVQRSLASRLQKQWIENPKSLGGSFKDLDKFDFATRASEVSHELKERSLKLLSSEAKAEMLP